MRPELRAGVLLLGGGRGAPLRDGRRHCVKLEHDAHGYGITLHVWARFCFWGARLSPLSCMSMCTIIISRVACFKLAKLVTVGAYIERERDMFQADKILSVYYQCLT